MKTKHNKKRNTAFVYETLLRESTVAMLKQDTERFQTAVKLVQKYFHSNSLLRKDLDCYRSLYETSGLDRLTSEKILKESKLQKRLINPKELFKVQTSLIHSVNKELGPDVFDNFVPNYKALATIAQIFSPKISPRNQVILENKIVEEMQAPTVTEESSPEIDNLVYRSFVEKFNDKYESSLLPEQKELLSYYIASFADNALELKIFLSEEIGRLKKSIEEAKEQEDFKQDEDMVDKADSLIAKLDSYSSQTQINESTLRTVLKTQALVKEIYTNGSSN